MKTALQQYIEDVKNGNCRGEDYYLQTEKQQIEKAYHSGLANEFGCMVDDNHYTSTFETNKETLK